MNPVTHFQECEPLLRDLLPRELRQATVELFPYFKDSFGNMTRIDYGTGANIACCLECRSLKGGAELKKVLLLHIVLKHPLKHEPGR